jgi:hypothetical protein
MPVKTSPTIPHYSTRRSSPFALPKKKEAKHTHLALAACVENKNPKPEFSPWRWRRRWRKRKKKKADQRSCVSTASRIRTPGELRMSDRRCGCSLGPTSDVRRENTLSACPVYLSTCLPRFWFSPCSLRGGVGRGRGGEGGPRRCVAWQVCSLTCTLACADYAEWRFICEGARREPMLKRRCALERCAHAVGSIGLVDGWVFGVSRASASCGVLTSR